MAIILCLLGKQKKFDTEYIYGSKKYFYIEVALVPVVALCYE